MMRALVVQMEKRERKKKGEQLEIIKIMYRRATVTMYINTVTVTHGNF